MLWPNDPFSALTHLAGAIVCAFAGVALVRRAEPSRRRWSLGIFAATAVVLLLASFTFHSLPSGSIARTVAQRLDHAAIFLLIAGTFTPIHAILFRGLLRWGMLAFIWAAAIAGLTLKVVFFNDVPEALGVSAYLAMGWLGVISMVCIAATRGIRFVSPLIVGGLAYSIGAVCEFTGQPTLIVGVIGSHEVFHVAVLAGLGCHWMFIRRLTHCEVAVPTKPRRIRTATASIEMEPKPIAKHEQSPV